MDWWNLFGGISFRTCWFGTHFVFLDYSETFIGFYLDYLADDGVVYLSGYYGGKLLRKLAEREKENDR